MNELSTGQLYRSRSNKIKKEFYRRLNELNRKKVNRVKFRNKTEYEKSLLLAEDYFEIFEDFMEIEDLAHEIYLHALKEKKLQSKHKVSYEGQYFRDLYQTLEKIFYHNYLDHNYYVNENIYERPEYEDIEDKIINKIRINELLNQLTRKERILIEEKYGLLDDIPKNNREVAEKFIDHNGYYCSTSISNLIHKTERKLWELHFDI